MIRSSRGNAGVGALLLAAAVFAGAVWLGFGSRDSRLESILAGEGSRGIRPTGPAPAEVVASANALCQEIENGALVRPLPRDVAFARAARTPATPPSEPPRVSELQSRIEGSRVVLSWAAERGRPPWGWVVERDADGTAPAVREELQPTSNATWRDSPVEALAGRRTYRVHALARDGTVADTEEKVVAYRVDFDVEFLGTDSEGRGLFRVTWDRAGRRIAEEFAAPPGGSIGMPVGPDAGRPALDLSTGWKYLRPEARRRVEPKEVAVPEFAPDGRVLRDSDGNPDLAVRTAEVARIEPGAWLLVPGGSEAEPVWTRKAKD